MVKPKQKFIYKADGTLDIQLWLAAMEANHSLNKEDIALLTHTHAFIQKLAQGLTTFYGRPYIEQSLEIAEVLLALKLDKETASAGMICGILAAVPLTDDIIRKELGETISKLIIGMRKTDIISALQQQKSGNQIQIDKIRKMLLAMATDIRVVLIKLAERLIFMSGIKSIPSEDRQRFAQEIFDIYAPLANRLGIGQIKWKLEDLAFRYQHPEAYKDIAKFLAERRMDRENHIHELIVTLQKELKAAHIKGSVTGRAKHIYSIYLKMQRKDIAQTEIYDHSAIRVLVPTIQDCYTILSIVNSLWPPIMQEFDDYIANPKPNGYRSIHTAVMGPNGKYVEFQIRTHLMHEESERGVAAHWLYKEGSHSQVDDRTKMAYLQQLIGWHQDVSNASETTADGKQASLSEDQVYVITPAGDIIDLPQGSTPIDFAYHIHSDIGHHCRGAKINGHIVPLTYSLRTGDKVDIHTVAEGGPSRDWLNPDLGFTKTSRARSKITHWFKQQALHQDIASGKQILERELARSGLAKSTSVLDIARHFTLKNEEELLAAIGRGRIGAGQIAHAIQPKPLGKTAPHPTFTPNSKLAGTSTGSAIAGASDLLTRYAKCCKPIPGEAIIGYITQTSGISIHKKNCRNVSHLANPSRFIDIFWDNDKTSAFITDLKIMAQDREKVLHDLMALFVQEKIKLINLNANTKKDHGKMTIIATLHIQNIDQLEHIKRRILQLPGVIEVMRVKK